RRSCGTHVSAGRSGIWSSSFLKTSRRSLDKALSPPHPCERLRDRRGDGAATDPEQLGDLCLALIEIEVRDDDRALARRQHPQELAHAEPVEEGVDLVALARHAAGFGQRELSPPSRAGGLAQSDAEEPASHV